MSFPRLSGIFSFILLTATICVGGAIYAWAQEGGTVAPLPPTVSAPGETPVAPPAAPVPGTATPAPAESQPAPAETTPPAAVETPPPTPEAAPARLVEIEIRGNEKIPQAEIQAQIKSKVGEPYDEARLEADRTAIHDMGWFAHVEASLLPVEGGVKAAFRVVENEVVKGVKIVGVTVPRPTEEDLLALLKTKPGQVANHKYLLEDIEALQKAYADQGYVLAQVAEREISPEGILTLTLLEGKIVEVRIAGNTETRRAVIERELRARPGQIYNARVLRKDIERVYNLGFFDDVRAHPEIGPEPGTVIVVVEIVERKRTGLATVGGGWGSVQGFVGFVNISKDNWRGTGQRINLKGEFGGVKSYEVGYFNPWIAPNHTSLNASGYNRLVTREAFKSGGGSFFYDERRVGGGLTLGRPFGEFTRGFVTIRRDDLRVENIRDATATTEDVLFRPQSITSISLSGVRDTRDRVDTPTRGNRASLALETAGLVGGAHFNKYTLDLRHYFSRGARPKEEDIAALRKRKVLAFRLLLGTTTGDPPFLEQFLLGGGETLRGYRQDRFPGRSLALLNSEFRFPLSDTLQGIVFADVGDAWGGSFSELFGDTTFRAHSSFGLGIQVQSPIGPLRLHYGIGSEGGQLHFGFGQMF